MSRPPAKRSRIVKLYFRDTNKVMRSIPHLQGLVRDDELRKVYTLKPGEYGKIIYILSDES